MRLLPFTYQKIPTIGITIASMLSSKIVTAIGPSSSSAAVGVEVSGTSYSLNNQKQPSSSSSSFSSTAAASPPPPEASQTYNLTHRTQISPNSCLLHFSLPPQRSTLGLDPTLPTCIKVTLPGGTDVYNTGTPTSTNDVSKSYSPISHPARTGSFELVVKGYPEMNEEDGVGTGGGVGAYLCSLRPPPPSNTTEEDSHTPVTLAIPPSSIIASLKAPRKMHGSPTLTNRWKHVGLIAGGTGIAPLFQLATLLLDDPSGYTTDVHLLFVNRKEEDILLRDRLEEMVVASKGRFRVTYSLTSLEEEEEEAATSNLEKGRGSVTMIQKSLPPPTKGDGSTMILVCGTDGFVDWWAGPVGRAPSTDDGKKGPKIQGPLLGLLRDAGYDESEVFKY